MLSWGIYELTEKETGAVVVTINNRTLTTYREMPELLEFIRECIEEIERKRNQSKGEQP